MTDTPRHVHSCRVLAIKLVLCTWFFASNRPCIADAPPTHEPKTRTLKTVEDVIQISMWGTEDPADWRKAYQILRAELGKRLTLNKGWTSEFELLGLTAQQISEKYGQQQGKLSDLSNVGMQTYSPQDGVLFFLRYKDGAVVSVMKNTGSCGGSSIGPWISNRQEALLRAEFDLTQALELAIMDWTTTPPTPQNAELRWHYKALYVNRAAIRDELQQEEFAVEDLLSARAIPVWTETSR